MYALKLLCFFCLLLVSMMPLAASPFATTENLPVAYQGRFRSLDSTARLWLYDLYHKQQLKNDDLSAFNTDSSSALNLLWLTHFHGHAPWDNAPLFWIHYAATKSLLSLPTTQERFSFDELAAPLKQQFTDPSAEISHLLHITQSYSRGIDTSLNMLPSRLSSGEWLSLHRLEQNSKNFTVFSDAHFSWIQQSYLNLKKEVLQGDEDAINEAAAEFSDAFSAAYTTLAGTPYQVAMGKHLLYPTWGHLRIETLYYQLPLAEIAIIFYVIALLLLILARPSSVYWGVLSLVTAFAIHTILLALRCYVLQRPPVSNMFETVVYVPWIATTIALICHFISPNRLMLIAGAIVSVGLLVLLKITQANAQLENVQAVLDSQYWLIVHVLMVVGSYGAFAICAVLAHLYLIGTWWYAQQSSITTLLARSILHTMYIGVALLIPGTILGGVWAAESWGRFWDWDPKESWAFISACVYLLIIHAYTFRRIGDFGLAIGAIAGIVAISFTWYGVNYILGTGLHSYGFGSGGEQYYFIYIAAELLFIIYILSSRKKLCHK